MELVPVIDLDIQLSSVSCLPNLFVVESSICKSQQKKLDVPQVEMV